MGSAQGDARVEEWTGDSVAGCRGESGVLVDRGMYVAETGQEYP